MRKVDYLLKMASRETISWSHEFSPLLGVFCLQKTTITRRDCFSNKSKAFNVWAICISETTYSNSLLHLLTQISPLLTGAIFETGAYGVPSKSQKSFICGGVRQTITLKSPGKGAPPSTPSWVLQWHPLFWMQY
jgi:hypothetical protein